MIFNFTSAHVVEDFEFNCQQEISPSGDGGSGR